MAADPKVSILINNYDYAEHLPRCLESALEQTFRDTEIIVVDDGSTDGSRAVIERYGDRVRAIFQENQGQAGAFNTGVAASTGEVLCFLDSDDAWHPHKVERVVEVLDANPGAGWLRHRLAMVDSSGRDLGIRLPGFSGSLESSPAPRTFIEGRYPMFTSAMVMRRAVAERVFPLPLEIQGLPHRPPVSLRFDADAYAAFRAAATGSALYSLDEVLGEYLRHDRQQYVGVEDLGRILHRQIDIAGGAARVFEEALGDKVVPTTVYKHQAVLAALEGAPLWSRARLVMTLRGVRAAFPLVGESPGLFLRQTGALAFGLLAPRLWAYKLLRRGGFPQPARALSAAARRR